MRELADILLHRAQLPCSRRTRTDCHVCLLAQLHNILRWLSHGAAATSHLGDPSIVEKLKSNFLAAPISTKLKALLTIAGKVQQDGKLVTEADVHAARLLGATDMEIHDTVLIAAAFSMYNRYVDGLGTVQPTDPGMYAQMGKHLAEEGYTKPSTRQPVTAV